MMGPEEFDESIEDLVGMTQEEFDQAVEELFGDENDD
jgi:hypothetical protein